jgi:hypothetical protein
LKYIYKNLKLLVLKIVPVKWKYRLSKFFERQNLKTLNFIATKNIFNRKLLNKITIIYLQRPRTKVSKLRDVIRNRNPYTLKTMYIRDVNEAEIERRYFTTPCPTVSNIHRPRPHPYSPLQGVFFLHPHSRGSPQFLWSPINFKKISNFYYFQSN